MSLYTLSSFEELPALKTPAGLTIRESSDPGLLSFLGNTTIEDVRKRLANDHHAFVAYLHHRPAAFGWMAKGRASIGELNHSFILPLWQRYLWNFRTLADYRGLGIYPALLQHIVRQGDPKAERFWIIHAPENRSSRKGITKAGFQYVGKLYADAGGSTRIEATPASDALRLPLEFMDIARSSETAASCWNCSSPYLKKRNAGCCCAPAGSACTMNHLLSLAS